MKDIAEILDTAIDELGYAFRTGDEANKDFYIKNAIRFIEEAMEEIKVLKEKNKLYEESFGKIINIILPINHFEVSEEHPRISIKPGKSGTPYMY